MITLMSKYLIKNRSRQENIYYRSLEEKSINIL